MSDTIYDDDAPFDQAEDIDPVTDGAIAFYGDDSGLIHMSIDCAERLDASYQNLGEYEPPSAMIDLTPENALKLRDGLTKALAAWRKDTKERS